MKYAMKYQEMYYELDNSDTVKEICQSKSEVLKFAKIIIKRKSPFHHSQL